MKRYWPPALVKEDAFGPLKFGEGPVNQTDRRSSFPNGRGHPLNASRPDVAHCEHSRQAALQHQRRPR